MSDITVERAASGISVEPLRKQVRGQVLTGVDAGYDEACAVHNGMFSKRPLAVLRAEQVADVIAGVNFARDNDLAQCPALGVQVDCTVNVHERDDRSLFALRPA